MLHLAAYDESVDASVTLNRLTPVADPVLRTTDTDFFYPPVGLEAIGAYYLVGPTVTRGILEAPSFGSVMPEVAPGDVAAEPLGNPNLHKRFAKPLPLTSNDKLAFAVFNGAADRSIGLVWFTPPAGIPVSLTPVPHITTRWTAAATLSANAWTNSALTYATTGLGLGTGILPSGRYGVVGMRAQSAGLIAARLVPNGGGQGPRPGVIGFDAFTDTEEKDSIFRGGRLGNGAPWTEFTDTSIPTVDFLSISADTAETVWLDLVYLGPTGTGRTTVQPRPGMIS